MTRPGLVLGAWVEVGDDHLYSLDLLVLGRDGAHLVRDFVSFHRHVLAIDAETAGMLKVRMEVRGIVSFLDIIAQINPGVMELK